MLYKRSKKPGAHWWVRFTIRGHEIRVTSGTDRKASAEEFERRLREQIWREQELGEISYTWDEAKERWLKEKAHKRSIRRDRDAFGAVEPVLSGQALRDIGSESASDLAERLSHNRKPAAVNRVLALVRSVLNACVKWGWLTSAPKVGLQNVDKREPRWIRQDQFASLVAELPPHLSRMARFAVATGLRWSNVSGLRWDMVDLERGVVTVPSGETKNRRAIPVPLSEGAKAVLRGLGERDGYVFRDQLGRAPIRSCKTAWKKACKRAGLEGFKFHDLRHTWAAWHTLNGTPPIILKELGGWSSLAMVERYSALNPGHLSEWADNISRTKNGTSESEK